MLSLGTPAGELAGRLGISQEQWREIGEACGQRVVAMEVECSEAE